MENSQQMEAQSHNVYIPAKGRGHVSLKAASSCKNKNIQFCLTQVITFNHTLLYPRRKHLIAAL